MALLALFVILLTCVMSIFACPVDLTPFSNWTYEIRDTEGHCNIIEAMQATTNNSKYEGRWYGAYIGLTKEQTKRVSCFIWDTVFDEIGQFHNFVSLKENGVFKVLNNIGTPLIEDKRIYRFYFDPFNTKSFLVTTYYYVDDEMIIWYHEECFWNKNIKQPMMLIGFRNLEDVKKNEAKFKLIYKSLEAKGAHSERNWISHEKCDYPAQMQDPFKDKKAAKLAKEKEEEKEMCKKEKL